jgi:gamma-glutamyltranspeptidase/glutathione hydrolase
MRLLSAAILTIAILAIAPALAEPAVEGGHGMVVTSQRLASEAGLEILKAGGNAVDAAVAVGYALAVVEPCCGNVGGGGFMVLRLADGRERFLNFREMAPAAATRDMYLDAAGNPIREASLTGFRAAGIPGSVMGLDTALREYGQLSRAQVMAPAIRLARDGFTLVEADLQDLRQEAPRLSQDPGAAAIFIRPDGRPWQAGD